MWLKAGYSTTDLSVRRSAQMGIKMGIFIKEPEKERLLQADRDSLQWRCYEALKARVRNNTRQDTLVQPGDTQEWYHLCWERISDASFLYHMEWYSRQACHQEASNEENCGKEAWGNEDRDQLGTWLHDRVMEIVRMSQDEWIGPWYRGRSAIPVGCLETSHITLAVCEAVDNCPSLFDEEEMNQCREAVREKGMLPCMRYCRDVVEQADHINNWFMVLLDGFGTAAALLGESEYIRLAAEWSHVAASLYDRDSYGESVQYSNYAAIHLSHLNEVLIRYGLAQDELNLKCYTGLCLWYAASFLYCKPLEQGGPLYPRTVNFGDSAAIFRPSGDVLVHIGSRMKEEDPRAASLASWMFETLYADPFEGPDEMASFGLFNQFQYHTILMLPDMAPPAGPGEVQLPEAMSFEGGQVIVRDRWENARTVAALQAGYRPYNVTGHRHKDQNSFQLVIGQERMLVDPGHCCYRLNAQKEAVSEAAHNTISLKKDGAVVEQSSVEGNIFRRSPSGNNLLANYSWGHVRLIASDMAGLYDGRVEKAVRVWVMNLPHQMLTVDIVKTGEDMSLCTHFNVNNRDNTLKVHKYSDQRLVLRRGGQALKLFEVFSSTDGEVKPAGFSFDWTAMHDFYHPLPNQAGQGREGSVNRYCWEDTPGREHIRIHTYVMDTSEDIVHWHVYLMDDGFVRMEYPDGDTWLEVKADMEQVVVRNEKLEEERLLLVDTGTTDKGR